MIDIVMNGIEYEFKLPLLDRSKSVANRPRRTSVIIPSAFPGS